MNKLIELKNISYTVTPQALFGRNEKKNILKDISFSINSNEIIGITGESGSGKTTLSKLLGGIIKPTSGKIEYYFPEMWQKTRTMPVQILFQNNSEILNPYRTVGKVIKEALETNKQGAKDTHAEMKRLLTSVGLSESLLERKGLELSGGEQQRVALIRVLAPKPELLILDEPFSAQDVESRLNLLTLFKKINTEFNLTMICVAHNLKILRKLADRIFVMYDGQIVESGQTEKIFSSPENDYTKFLLKCENYNLRYEDLKFSRSL